MYTVSLVVPVLKESIGIRLGESKKFSDVKKQAVDVFESLYGACSELDVSLIQDLVKIGMIDKESEVYQLGMLLLFYLVSSGVEFAMDSPYGKLFDMFWDLLEVAKDSYLNKALSEELLSRDRTVLCLLCVGNHEIRISKD